MRYKITLKHTVLPLLLFSITAAIIIVSISAHAITRGYLSDDDGLQPGMLVKISDDSNPDTPKVERATLDQADKIIGVATTTGESTVTIASADQSVYVETTGEVNAYVSDMFGEVKEGDLLVVSPLNGVMAKYTSGAAVIFALALEDSAPKSGDSYEIQTPEGKKNTKLSLIKVNLDQKGSDGLSKVPTSLEKLGKSITGKEVNELRVIVALLIFIIVLIVEGAILYGSISSAVTSIGRNPLASKVIRRELIKVMTIAFLVMLIGLGSIYLVLWV